MVHIFSTRALVHLIASVMLFRTIFLAFVALAAGANAQSSLYTNSTPELRKSFSISFTAANHYGAPIPPWKPGCKPGWYYGNKPFLVGIIIWLKDDLICFILDLLLGLKCPKFPTKPPTKPPPSDGWTQTFSNHTGATQADDYITYGLVDTIDDCKTMCNNVEGCGFINTYHDVNGKGGSPLLTCSLFASCHNIDTATNTGGQTQPDGSINYITESDGYCKVA